MRVLLTGRHAPRLPHLAVNLCLSHAPALPRPHLLQIKMLDWAWESLAWDCTEEACLPGRRAHCIEVLPVGQLLLCREIETVKC